MSDLAKELRIMAGMITMCERISFGSDSALMKKAATEIDRLERENDELKAKLVEVNNNRTGVSPCAKFCEALAAKKMFDNLQRENSELKAQVKMLRIRLDDILEDMQLSLALTENDCDIWKGRIKDTLATKPSQCLAEINAQAGREGFMECYFPLRKAQHDDVFDLVKAADEYANQLRQQAKVGE